MTAEPSNASTERILHLMLLLMQGEYSKDEIFSRITAYERGAEDDARRRMLDRDLATMQKAGIEVSRHAGRYFIAPSQFERRARVLCSEPMYPTALDRPLLLWIPRSRAEKIRAEGERR